MDDHIRMVTDAVMCKLRVRQHPASAGRLGVLMLRQFGAPRIPVIQNCLRGIAGQAGRRCGIYPLPVAAHIRGMTITAPGRVGETPDDSCAPIVDSRVVDHPRVPVNARFPRAEIDSRATGVVAAARGGVVWRAHARRVIAAMVDGSSILETVAAGWNGTKQYRADIADR